MASDPGPGDDYSNWIPTVRQKIKDREKKLLEIKVNNIESIVNQQLIRFPNFQEENNVNYAVSDKTLNECMQQLHEEVSSWTGIDLSRTKKEITNFKKYFSVSKNWWDNRKKHILGTAFWIAIFNEIQNFVEYWAAQIYPNQIVSIRKFTQCVMTQMTCGLVSGTVKYSNTKTLPLLSTGIIRSCKELQFYFLSIDKSLDIQKWIQDIKIQPKDHMHTKILNVAHKLREKLLSQLETISSAAFDAFCNEATSNETDAKTQSTDTSSISSSTNNNTQTMQLPNFSTNAFADRVEPQNTINNNAYFGTHQSSFTVTDHRYNPMIVLPVPVLYYNPNNVQHLFYLQFNG